MLPSPAASTAMTVSSKVRLLLAAAPGMAEKLLVPRYRAS